ncbi:MAG TPA: ZIP family metal transporter [Stellaceae bacterium]|nr:ZIP family metal transporter [Stellaceae bacterium]
MTLLAISFCTFLATLAGGLFAMREGGRRHLILGLSAGAVIGVAFFDLIPESLELAGHAYDAGQITQITAAGFLLYMMLDRAVPRQQGRGGFAAASLVAHSFLDGFSIGLAFKVSVAVGLIVAVAVIVHDMFDGINTVSVVLANKGGDRAAWRWLVLDAVAPIAGAASTVALRIENGTLGLCLAIFGGFFLYIGASELMPASARGAAPLATAGMTVLGAALLYLAVALTRL